MDQHDLLLQLGRSLSLEHGDLKHFGAARMSMTRRCNERRCCQVNTLEMLWMARQRGIYSLSYVPLECTGFSSIDNRFDRLGSNFKNQTCKRNPFIDRGLKLFVTFCAHVELVDDGFQHTGCMNGLSSNSHVRQRQKKLVSALVVRCLFGVGVAGVSEVEEA